MSKWFVLQVFLLGVVASSSAFAAPQTYLCKGTFALNQKRLDGEVLGKKVEFSEGCGAIAVSMLLGYWQTEKGEGKLLVNDNAFDGTRISGSGRPSDDIKRVRDAIKSVWVVASTASYTKTKNLYEGLAKLVSSRMLKVGFLSHKESWKTRKRRIKSALRRGEPVLLRKEKEHKFGCVSAGKEIKNVAEAVFNNETKDHYYLAVGYKGKDVAVLPGWGHADRGTMDTWQAFVKAEGDTRYAYKLCTFDGLKKTMSA